MIDRSALEANVEREIELLLARLLRLADSQLSALVTFLRAVATLLPLVNR